MIPIFSIRTVIDCLPKNSVVNKEEFIPRPAAKLQADNIELTIFKGANPSLATDIAKVVIRYAH